MNTFQHMKKIGNSAGALINAYRLSKPMKIKGENHANIIILSTTESYQSEPELGMLKRMVSYVMPGDASKSEIPPTININDALKVDDHNQQTILNLHGYWELSK